MKKKIFSLVLAICLIIPCMFIISGCKQEKSKYADLVSNINKNQEFARQNIEEIIDNTTKTNFKFEVSDQGIKETAIFSFSNKSIYFKTEFDGYSYPMLQVYMDDICYVASYGEVYVDTIASGGNFFSNVKSATSLEKFEQAIEYTAKAYKNYYEVSADVFDEESEENITMKVRIADGLVRKITLETYGVINFQYIGESELIDIYHSDFDDVESLSFSSSVTNGRSIEVGLFEKVNELNLHENLMLSDEVEVYIADNFLEVEDNYYERNMPV